MSLRKFLFGGFCYNIFKKNHILGHLDGYLIIKYYRRSSVFATVFTAAMELNTT